MVGGHVVDSTEHTTYSFTTKYVSTRLMLLIAVNNGLGFMAGDIGNEFCKASCAEKIWSCCGAEFGLRCGALAVLKRDLYGLKTASNSFQKYSGDFLRDLGLTPSREYQDLCIQKYDKYDVYDYIETHMDDIIITAKNPYKYMHEIEMHFKVRSITDPPNYYRVNELLQVVYRIHVSSNNYVYKIIHKYQKTHGDLNKEVLLMRVKEKPELDYSLFFNEKEHNESKHIIGVCQWLIVVVRFEL